MGSSLLDPFIRRVGWKDFFQVRLPPRARSWPDEAMTLISATSCTCLLGNTGNCGGRIPSLLPARRVYGSVTIKEG